MNAVVTMEDAESLFYSLRLAGVEIENNEGKIRIRNPGRLTDDHKSRLKAVGPALLDTLRRPWSERAQEEWDLYRSFQEAAMGDHAGELTDADIRRIVALEAQIDGAIQRCNDGNGFRRVQALIANWMTATTPLRWLPHGPWHAERRGGVGPDTYRHEARLRGVLDADLCGDRGVGSSECGGACGGVARTAVVATGATGAAA